MAASKLFNVSQTGLQKVETAEVQAGTKCCSMVAPLRGTVCKKEAKSGKKERMREEGR